MYMRSVGTHGAKFSNFGLHQTFRWNVMTIHDY